MSARKYLTISQVAVLDAILERGHNYGGVRTLLPNLAEDGIISESGLRSSALTGFGCLKRIFSSVREDGTLLGDNRDFVPICEKKFLRKIKNKYPNGPEDIHDVVYAFFNKKSEGRGRD
ncbi:MAG: hypothetical protein V1819_02265 [bacterium]